MYKKDKVETISREEYTSHRRWEDEF